MTDTGRRCSYTDDIQDLYVTYLYDDEEIEGALADDDRARLREHIHACEVCAAEVRSLQAVREALREWTPPEPRSRLQVVAAPSASQDYRHRGLRGHLGMATLAASVVLVGVALAGIEVRYGGDGFVVRIGQTTSTLDDSADSASLPAETVQRPAGSKPPDTVTANRESASALSAPPGGSRGSVAPRVGYGRMPGDLLFGSTGIDRLQVLRDESARRQQQEFSLWLTELALEFDTQRMADQRRLHDQLGSPRSYSDYFLRAADNER